MHQIYDVLLKDIIKDVPPKFLKILTGYETGRFLDIQLPDVQVRQPDLLVEVEDGNIVHIEIQSTDDKSITKRMYEYSALINRQFNKLPLQTLLYIGDKEVTTVNRLCNRDVNYSYRVIDVKEVDCCQLLQSDRPEDLVLAILCKTDDVDGAIKTIVDRLSVLSPKDAKDYCLKLLYLSNLKKLYNKVKKEVDNMPITFDIRESEMFLDGKREGLIEGQKKGLIEGQKKGLIEGQKKGLIEGQRKGLIEGIEMALEIKYGSKGLELMDMVRNIHEIERLNQLKVLIKRSGTPDELRATLVDILR
ncbi:MAG: hypothetical protein HQL06_06695 [Nitrospirae bacterium]|nr:hypothetical protein [Nitrospirota bacterium]